MQKKLPLSKTNRHSTRVKLPKLNEKLAKLLVKFRYSLSLEI